MMNDNDTGSLYNREMLVALALVSPLLPLLAYIVEMVAG